MFDTKSFTDVGSYLYYKEIKANKKVQTDFDQENLHSPWKSRILLIGSLLFCLAAICGGLYRNSMILQQQYREQEALLKQEVAARLELEARLTQVNLTPQPGDAKKFCLTDFVAGNVLGGLSFLGEVFEVVGYTTKVAFDGTVQLLYGEAAALVQDFQSGSAGPIILTPSQNHKNDFTAALEGIWASLPFGKGSHASSNGIIEHADGNVTICEGSTYPLSCPSTLVISISNASYGKRSASVCPGKCHGRPSTACSYDVTSFVDAICTGSQSCSVTASNSAFNHDPCPGTCKYLSLSYSCSET